MGAFEQSKFAMPTGACYEAGAIKVLTPDLVLQDMPFSRASLAQRMAKNGFYQYENNNVPRFDYSRGLCPSLMIERESENHLIYSREYQNAAWTKGGATASDNSAIGLSGGMTASTLTEDTSNGGHFAFQLLTIMDSPDTPAVISVPAAFAGRRIQVTNSYNGDFATFDLSSGTIEDGVGIIDPIPGFDGFYRCSIITTTNGSGQIGLTLYLADNTNDITYIGDGASGVIIDDSQIEFGTYPTSIIHTESASVVRNQDIAYKLIDNSPAVSLVFEVSEKNFDLDGVIISLSNSSPEFMVLRANGDELTLRFFDGVNDDIFVLPFVFNNGDHKIGISYTGTDVMIAMDGTVEYLTLVNTGPYTTFDRLDIGSISGDPATYPIYTQMKNLIYFEEALTDTQLIEYTQ